MPYYAAFFMVFTMASVGLPVPVSVVSFRPTGATRGTRSMLRTGTRNGSPFLPPGVRYTAFSVSTVENPVGTADRGLEAHREARARHGGFFLRGAGRFMWWCGIISTLLDTTRHP